MTDTDEETRYIALSALLRAGRIFSEAQAKAALVKPGSGGLLGGFGLTMGNEQFERYKRDMLAKKTDAELERLVASQTILDRDASFELFERHFPERKGELAALVADQFKLDFEAAFEAMTARTGLDSQSVKDIRNLEEHIRKDFTRKALDIICRAGEPEHLSLVRNVLTGDFVGYSELDIEYLRQHGEWQDIPLLIAAASRIRSGISLLSSGSTEEFQAISKAIYAIGKDRLNELLELEIPKQLLKGVLLEMSDKGFKSILREKIKGLLFDADETVRKITALRVVRSYPKRRVVELLGEYINSSEQHFYNVVHWLDLGASAPKDLAQQAAGRVLRIEWPSS